VRPASFPSPLNQPRKGKRQQESANQRLYVKALLATGLGFFHRVKNMGTFDPIRKCYRKDYGMALVAIPDICGYIDQRRKSSYADIPGAQPCYIEVKNVQGVEKKRKLVFKCKITDDQKEFLLRAHRAGALAGVAFTLEDALSIAHDDALRYPRHPRTWMFLDLDAAGRAELAEKVDRYEKQKKVLSQLKQDPVASVVVLGGTQEP
jgi:hypothetical protein